MNRLRRLVRAGLAGGELRWLRQQLPSVHRRWVHTTHAIRRESNDEYLTRLKQIGRERADVQTPQARSQARA
jgi:hypothetical protein